jgi:hypothetical protein
MREPTLTVLIAILFGLLIVGAMLISRLSGVLAIFDLFRTVRMETQVLDMYEKAKEDQRKRRRD